MKPASDMVQAFEYARRDLELERPSDKHDNMEGSRPWPRSSGADVGLVRQLDGRFLQFRTVDYLSCPKGRVRPAPALAERLLDHADESLGGRPG